MSTRGAEDQPSPGARSRPVTILNVTPDAERRGAITAMLQAGGYRPVEAASGREAMARARNEQPDLMVLDSALPDIDGVEVCRHLKRDAATASMLVLHTSAAASSADLRIRGAEAGADGFITQPFTREALLATIDALLRWKDMEDAQRQRAEALAEADRRKDDFLAMLGHELRNPLNAIAMAHALVERYPPHDEIERRARAVADRQTTHLTRIVDDLLDVSRVTRGMIALDLQPIDLTTLLQQVIAVAEETLAAPRHQTIVAALPAGGVPICGDRVRLEQVFANLLDNASKFSAEGGHIHVELSVAESEGDAHAVVTISDAGRGIPPEQIDHVFKLFYQGWPTEARTGSGMGIGLTLVRSLVESHAGTVTARSSGRDQGSVFEVRLPVAQVARTAAEDHGAGLCEPPHARRGVTVLIVEDNPDARELLDTLCSAWGYHVELAGDGHAGVARALELRPYVALIDIGLPGLDGYEVARRIRAVCPPSETHLIALTGYGLPAQREKALAAGFDLHLLKPVDPDLLASVLDSPEDAIAELARKGHQAD